MSPERDPTRRDPGPIEVDAGEGTSIAVDPASGTMMVRTGRLARILSIDEALLLSVGRHRGPWRTGLARALTRMGDAQTWTAVGLALVLSGARQGIRLGLRLGAATMIATATSQALKRSLTRARPDVSIAGFEPLAMNPDRFSFPSGHTAAAFGVAVAFADEPCAAGPVSLLVAVGIALSRVYLGAHYPLDVAAGAVIGVGSGIASRLLVP
jgi:undecaprenyl-diphosphatase